MSNYRRGKTAGSAASGRVLLMGGYQPLAEVRERLAGGNFIYSVYLTLCGFQKKDPGNEKIVFRISSR